MDLIVEIVKLAAALAQLAVALSKFHSEIADESRADEEEGR